MTGGMAGMNENPGRPSEANAATANVPANAGVRAASPE